MEPAGRQVIAVLQDLRGQLVLLELLDLLDGLDLVVFKV
jgi:hypothetical protein